MKKTNFFRVMGQPRQALPKNPQEAKPSNSFAVLLPGSFAFRKRARHRANARAVLPARGKTAGALFLSFF
jgi:hypothetical protein